MIFAKHFEIQKVEMDILYNLNINITYYNKKH